MHVYVKSPEVWGIQNKGYPLEFLHGSASGVGGGNNRLAHWVPGDIWYVI